MKTKRMLMAIMFIVACLCMHAKANYLCFEFVKYDGVGSDPDINGWLSTGNSLLAYDCDGAGPDESVNTVLGNISYYLTNTAWTCDWGTPNVEDEETAAWMCYVLSTQSADVCYVNYLYWNYSYWAGYSYGGILMTPTTDYTTFAHEVGHLATCPERYDSTDYLMYWQEATSLCKTDSTEKGKFESCGSP